ncbi:hypothetical protein ACXX9E_29730 [Pseudomonas sp. GNP014]
MRQTLEASGQKLDRSSTSNEPERLLIEKLTAEQNAGRSGDLSTSSSIRPLWRLRSRDRPLNVTVAAAG